jgi:serine protease
MKKITLLVSAVVLFTISCNKQEIETSDPVFSSSAVLRQKANPAPVPVGDPLPASEIDKMIAKKMDQQNTFSWQDASLQYIWSAAVNSDHVVAVGYQPIGVTDVEKNIHLLNLSAGNWKQVHDAIIKLVLDGINKDNPDPVTLEQILTEDDKKLPILTFKITNRNVLTALYNLENTRYLEPLGYYPADARFRVLSTSGCSASTQSLNTADWTIIAPNCRLPWNYNNVNIPAAWNVSQGEGIKIGVIDGGISSTQALLGSQFNNGFSNVSRTVTTDYTYGTSAYTTCTHGTSMTGLAAGPRNDQDAVTGVAYKASLHFIHACEDVVLDQSAEKTGVKNALIRMGDIADVKIVSMSVGSPFASNVLKDGCIYAYNNGKMLLAAAGTSFSWTTWWGVVYPAAYSQCYAITGVKENGSTCNSCHDGSQVKFTIPMERSTNANRNSLSLPLSGSTPTYIGGSSCATATAAGIAALVWGVKPVLTRDQVYTCMKNTAQYYPNPNSSRGYGNLNASAAVALAQTY